MSHLDDPNRIKLENCKHRGLYKIKSRNLTMGVYDESSNGFCGLRVKFGNKYLFEEYHIDYDGAFKTAAPMELLPDELPDDLVPTVLTETQANAALFRWLESMEKKYSPVMAEVTLPEPGPGFGLDANGVLVRYPISDEDYD